MLFLLIPLCYIYADKTHTKTTITAITAALLYCTTTQDSTEYKKTLFYESY